MSETKTLGSAADNINIGAGTILASKQVSGDAERNFNTPNDEEQLAAAIICLIKRNRSVRFALMNFIWNCPYVVIER